MPIATISLRKVVPKTQFGYSVNSALSPFARMYIHIYVCAYSSIFVSALKHVFVVSVAFAPPAHELPVPLGCRASYVRSLSLHRAEMRASVSARFACVRINSSFIKSAFGVCFVLPLCFDSLLIKNN